MSLLALVWANLRHRPLAYALNGLLLALAMALITLVLLIGEQLGKRLSADAQGVDLVIGAKGSPLQVILSSVYHVDVPTGNIRLAEALRVTASPMIGARVPIALGDQVGGYRIVGTEPEFLDFYAAGVGQGRAWAGRYEALIGAKVQGLDLGSEFHGAHGLSGGDPHDHADYRVVGRLEPTGTVLDRLVLTSLESVWALHGQPVDSPAREITALLVRYASPIAAAMLPQAINRQSGLVAASPAFETARLLSLLGIGLDTFRALAAVLLAVAGLSLFVALYNALEARGYDIAVMRSLGASRLRVSALLWSEGLLLALIGTLAGMLMGHLALEVLGRTLASGGPPALSGWAFAGSELLCLPLALLIGTLASLIPAWRAYRTDIAGALSR